MSEEITYSGHIFKIEPMCAKDQVDVSIYTSSLAIECLNKYSQMLTNFENILESNQLSVIADAAIFFFDKLASLPKDRFDFCFYKLLSGVKRKEGQAFQIISNENSLIYPSNVISFDVYHFILWRAFLVNYKDFIYSRIQLLSDNLTQKEA